jgi:membrane protein implicated in regulation of membrane protease activity
MLSFYLFALIVGGGLLLFSLISGDGSDADSAEVGADTDAGIDAHAHHGFGEPGWVGVQDFLSIRSLLYLLAGFGASGTLIDLLTDASTGVGLVWAILTGLVAAAMAAGIYGWVRRTDSGEVPTDPEYLRGIAARVVLPVRPGQRGKIVALHGGREVELLARLHGSEDAVCPRGSEVVIVDIDGDTALVTALTVFPSDSSLE